MRLKQTYISSLPIPPAGLIYVPAMGVNEKMPAGLVRHGGKGEGYGCLLMVFHGAAQVLAPNLRDWLKADHQFVIWDIEAEHYFGNPSSNWNHSWLWVRGRWIEQTLRNGILPLGTPFDSGGDALPSRHLLALLEELRGHVHQNPAIIQAYLQLFLLDLERQLNAKPLRHDPRLEKARDFIDEHYERPFSLREVAAQVHLSPNHFCGRFTRRFGVPPREYAMRLRMQRAAQLLTYEDLAVYQVAEMVGCPDAHYFSRLFRKRLGQSPQQFREQERLKSGTS